MREDAIYDDSFITMKKFLPLILFLMLSASVFAQTGGNSVVVKAALIDTKAFDDGEKGIKLLVNANEILKNIEYFEINNLTKRIKETKLEIDSLIAAKKPITEAFSKLKALENQLGKAEAEKKEEFNRKYSYVVAPVMDKIRKKFAEFALKKGYTILIDKSNGSVLTESDVEDVTTEFVKFCNDAFAEIPLTNYGKLSYICFNALEFSDSGVKKLKEYDTVCPYDKKYEFNKWRSERMSDVLKRFAKERQIKFLIDGNEIWNNPPEIWEIVSATMDDKIDETDNFIVFYNDLIKKEKDRSK